jgi:hypothetical protein
MRSKRRNGYAERDDARRSLGGILERVFEFNRVSLDAS